MFAGRTIKNCRCKKINFFILGAKKFKIHLSYLYFSNFPSHFMTVMRPYHYSSLEYASKIALGFVVCLKKHNNSCRNSIESCLENVFFSTTIFFLLQVMQDWLSISKILNRLCALRSMCLSKLFSAVWQSPSSLVILKLCCIASKRDDHSNLSLHPKQYV